MRYQVGGPISFELTTRGTYQVKGVIHQLWGPFGTEVVDVPLIIWVPKGYVAIVQGSRELCEDGWLIHQQTMFGDGVEVSVVVTNLRGHRRTFHVKELFDIVVVQYHGAPLTTVESVVDKEGVKTVRLSGTVQRTPRPSPR